MKKLLSAIVCILLLAPFAATRERDFYAEAEDHYYAGRFADAIRIALEGVAQPGVDEEAAVELYSILGASYSRLGAFDKAADYMVRCYEYDKANGESAGLTSSLINLASMYVYAGQPELAEQYALDAIANEEKVGRPDKLAMALGKACDVYHAQGRDSLALEYANRAVDTARGVGPSAQAVRRSQRAYALEALGRYREALVDLLYAEDVFRADMNRQSLSVVCFQLAQEYGRQGNKTRERMYLREAAALARDLGDLPLLQKIDTRLSESLSGDNPAEALGFLREASTISDSIARSKSTHALELYNIEFETERREETIRQQELQLRKERTLRTVLIVFSLLLLALAAMAVVMTVRSRRNARKLEESNTQKDFLLRVISHDIYSPAAARLKSLQMIRPVAASLPPEQLGKLFQDMEQQSKAEVEFLDNVLRWSKSRTGEQGEQVRFDLCALVNEVAGQYSQTAALKCIKIETTSEGPVIVVSNRSSVMLALRNLISNAVKFSPSGASVDVSVTREGGKASVAVQDHGIGIPEDKIASLFTPGKAFRRQGTGGEVSNGIGLMVSHGLIDGLGGTIDIESREGEGSKFTINLPDNG